MLLLSLRFESAELRLALRHTPLGQVISDAAPFAASVHTWGQTLMFDCPIPFIPPVAETSKVVQPGDIAFWVDGSSIVIGYGPTPLSFHNEIRLAHPAVIWADALDDVTLLQDVAAGSRVEVSVVENSLLKNAAGQ